MVGARRMRWMACILFGLACLSGCAKQEAASPPPPPPPPPPQAVTAEAPRETAPNPPSQPNYAWLPPKEPMLQGATGLFSIAVSYGITQQQLQDFLVQHRINSLRPKKSPSGNQGTVQSQDGGAIVFIRAKLSCMGLTCPPDSGSIRTLAGGHTAYWEWPVEPPADESGDGIITVQFEGGRNADGSDFKALEEIPAIRVPITIHWTDWIKTLREALEGLAAIAGVVLGFWHWLLPLLRRFQARDALQRRRM
jgi:hypothetical protein